MRHDLIFRKDGQEETIKEVDKEIEFPGELREGEFVILEEITTRCCIDLRAIRKNFGAEWKVDKVENIIGARGLSKKIYLIPV